MKLIASAVFIVFIATGCVVKDTASVKNAKVEVFLNGDVNLSKGLNWRRNNDGFVRTWLIEGARTILIRFESGRVYEGVSSMSFLSQEHGVIDNIQMTPLGKLVVFGQAATVLEGIIDKLDVHDAKIAREKIETWRKKPPASDRNDSRSLRILVEKRCFFFCRD